MDPIVSAVLGAVGGLVVGLITNYISPPFNRWVNSIFSKVSQWLNPERFDLTGNWEQIFEEPISSNVTQKQTIKEKIKLKHVGTVITGEGVTNIDPRHFTYKCIIKHSMLYGEYVKKGEQGNISGNGLIQLIVSPDRLSMEGQATWYDKDTKKLNLRILCGRKPCELINAFQRASRYRASACEGERVRQAWLNYRGQA